MPFTRDGDLEDLPPTINEVMGRAVEVHRRGLTPNTLCALAALVTGLQQRRGLSTEILRAMRSLAAGHGMHSLVAPVRPTLKSLYPLTPIERYALWKRDDGSPFDPSIRVHWRLGAEYLKLAPEALVVMGTVAEWEEWTAMSFPESGEYAIPERYNPSR